MPLYYQERPALGSRVQMGLVVSRKERADAVFKKLWLELLLFEKRCSRFLPDSELSQFNRAAGVRMPVSAEFRAILVAAQHMARQTGGLFNPFVLPSLQRHGYAHSLVEGHDTDAYDDHSSKRLVGAERLELGDNWASIPYGTALDLGGCGKGYIGDVLAEIVAGYKVVTGYWLGIGGDVIAGGYDDAAKPWTVYLQPDPKRPERLGQVTLPTDGSPMAVATSTTLLRQGLQAGKRWHHIIDPRTGLPADSDMAIVVVVGNSLLQADVIASCGIIIGAAAAKDFMHGQGAVDAAWLTHSAQHLQTIGTTVKAYDTWTAIV